MSLSGSGIPHKRECRYGVRQRLGLAEDEDADLAFRVGRRSTSDVRQRSAAACEDDVAITGLLDAPRCGNRCRKDCFAVPRDVSMTRNIWATLQPLRDG